MKNLRKPVYISLGCLCVALALVGVFLPVLPTTPFLLLAAFFFTRSSKRALHWLENNRLFGEYLRNYRQGRGMKLSDKIITISLLWAGIGLSIVYLVEHRLVDLLLLGVAAGVTYHLARLKTYRSET